MPAKGPLNVPAAAADRIEFRYVWPVRIVHRQLEPNEDQPKTILHISPKFATVHGRLFVHIILTLFFLKQQLFCSDVSFQWTLKMHYTPNTVYLSCFKENK